MHSHLKQVLPLSMADLPEVSVIAAGRAFWQAPLDIDVS